VSIEYLLAVYWSFIGRLLAGALAVSFGLVGIHFAHALEQFLNVGLVDFGSAGAFAAAAGCWTCRPGLL
jgi:hypothetical protein